MKLDQDQKDKFRGEKVRIEKADGSQECGTVTMYDDTYDNKKGGLWLRSATDTMFIAYDDIKDITIEEPAPEPAEPQEWKAPVDWHPRVEERTHRKLKLRPTKMSAPAAVCWVSGGAFVALTVLGLGNWIIDTVLVCLAAGSFLTWLLRKMEHR
jgi:hypothetical protein